MYVDRQERQLEVALTNQQQNHAFDARRLVSAAESALGDGEIRHAVVSVAVVDDATIHDLNRRFLDHDYPTDVLSFPLENRDRRLEGEVVVSADTAAREAEHHGWDLQQELELYVIHGCLHLIGMDDGDPDSRLAMRAAENKHMRAIGSDEPWGTAAEPDSEGGATR